MSDNATVRRLLGVFSAFFNFAPLKNFKRDGVYIFEGKEKAAMETALMLAELSRFLPPGFELFAVSFLTISRRALKGGLWRSARQGVLRASVFRSLRLRLFF